MSIRKKPSELVQRPHVRRSVRLRRRHNYFMPSEKVESVRSRQLRPLLR